MFLTFRPISGNVSIIPERKQTKLKASIREQGFGVTSHYQTVATL